jgi:hypothetical protein
VHAHALYWGVRRARSHDKGWRLVQDWFASFHENAGPISFNPIEINDNLCNLLRSLVFP